MKKQLSILAGSVGTTAAWYILSNKKLRTELGKAKNPGETLTVLKRYLGRDAEKISKEVHAFVQSEEVKGGLASAKQFTEEKFSIAKRGFSGLLARGKKMKDEVVSKMKGDSEEK